MGKSRVKGLMEAGGPAMAERSRSAPLKKQGWPWAAEGVLTDFRLPPSQNPLLLLPFPGFRTLPSCGLERGDSTRLQAAHSAHVRHNSPSRSPRHVRGRCGPPTRRAGWASAQEHSTCPGHRGRPCAVSPCGHRECSPRGTSSDFSRAAIWGNVTIFKCGQLCTYIWILLF